MTDQTDIEPPLSLAGIISSPSLRTYLASRPALADVVREAGRKMRSYNGLSGEVRLKNPKAIEEVRGIGAELHARDTRVRLTALDDAFLHRTQFACTLREAVDAISETPLVLRQEEQKWREAATEWMTNEVTSRCTDLGPVAEMVQAQWRESDPAWATALVDAAMVLAPATELTSGEPNRERLLSLRELSDTLLAIRAAAAARTAERPFMLPVLAERLTGDPHALDPDQSGGRAFLLLLQHVAPSTSDGDPESTTYTDAEGRAGRHVGRTATGLSADERAALYAANNVAIDAISSTVAVWNLRGGGPVLAAARATGMPIVLPLAALEGLPSDEPLCAAHDTMWVVENPAVFQALTEATRNLPLEQRPTLICGSGFLSLAALRLLDQVVASGARILYSGDWDGNGLAIAHAALKRWPKAVRLWRMDPALDPHAPVASTAAPWRVNSAATTIAPAAWAMVREQPRYQEAWIDALIADVRAAAEWMTVFGLTAG